MRPLARPDQDIECGILGCYGRRRGGGGECPVGDKDRSGGRRYSRRKKNGKRDRESITRISIYFIYFQI